MYSCIEYAMKNWITGYLLENWTMSNLNLDTHVTPSTLRGRQRQQNAMRFYLDIPKINRFLHCHFSFYYKYHDYSHRKFKTKPTMTQILLLLFLIFICTNHALMAD